MTRPGFGDSSSETPATVRLAAIFDAAPQQAARRRPRQKCRCASRLQVAHTSETRHRSTPRAPRAPPELPQSTPRAAPELPQSSPRATPKAAKASPKAAPAEGELPQSSPNAQGQAGPGEFGPACGEQTHALARTAAAKPGAAWPWALGEHAPAHSLCIACFGIAFGRHREGLCNKLAVFHTEKWR